MANMLLHMNGADLYEGNVSFTGEPSHHGPICRIRPPLSVIDRIEIWWKRSVPVAWDQAKEQMDAKFPGPPQSPLKWESTTIGGAPAVNVFCSDAFYGETVSFRIWGRQ